MDEDGALSYCKLWIYCMGGCKYKIYNMTTCKYFVFTPTQYIQNLQYDSTLKLIKHARIQIFFKGKGGGGVKMAIIHFLNACTLKT